MSLNTVSSAPLPWSLWLLFFLSPVAQTASSAPATAASPRVDTTLLLFDGGAPSHNLRNCSCPSPVRDCDTALADALCRCHTVLRSALPPAGRLGAPERLTVWAREPWVLRELLNGSAVAHLHLSFCGLAPAHSEYLALLGLRTLRIHSSTPGAPYPDQEITVAPSAGVAAELETLPFRVPSSLHVTLLDVAVLNGLSALKAYSVAGPPARALSRNFPRLVLPGLGSAPPAEATDSQKLLITFVY